MWPFKRRDPDVWELFPARPEDKQGSLSEEERAFIFWAVETSPVVRARDLKESRRMYRGAVEAGNQAMADLMLNLTLSLNGTNMHRMADNDYWEEYQRVMIGHRVDRINCLLGKEIPTGDTRPWRTHPSRALRQPPPW